MIKCRFGQELIWHRNKVDPNRTTRFMVVDTNSWSRLDGMDPLTEKPGLKIHLWDHHEGTGNIKRGETPVANRWKQLHSGDRKPPAKI